MVTVPGAGAVAPVTAVHSSPCVDADAATLFWKVQVSPRPLTDETVVPPDSASDTHSSSSELAAGETLLVTWVLVVLVPVPPLSRLVIARATPGHRLPAVTSPGSAGNSPS